MDPRYLALNKLMSRDGQPVQEQPAPNYRDLVAPPQQPNKYQGALDSQLTKAQSIAQMRQRQAQMRAAVMQPKQQAQAPDPQHIIDSGLRDGNVRYADLDQLGMNRDQFSKFRDGVTGIKQRYGVT